MDSSTASQQDTAPTRGLLSLDQAQRIVLAAAVPHSEPLPLTSAYGRVLAQDLNSPQASPLFDNSAMDGFAVGAADRAQFELIGEVAAGQIWSGPDLQAAQAIRIMTGAEVPASAAAVVPIEEVDRPKATTGTINVTAPIRPGQHIRRQGEEFKPGDVLLKAGMRLNPAAIGLLATVGMARVPIYRAPRVGILATGSELLPVDAALAPGRLRDSNSPTLAACVTEAGAEAVLYGILPDEPRQIRAGLEKAFAECDIVLTSGGVSVGDYDYVQEILLAMGLERKFWKVAIKPGKPALFGTLQGKLLFGIPGNPASGLTVFELLVRPALRKLLGENELFRPLISGRLASAVRPAPDRLQLLRLIYRDGEFRPLRGQSSSNLLTVAQANALMAVDRAYAAGETISAWRIDG